MERIATSIIKNNINNHKVIIIIGQRQVGKTYVLSQAKNIFQSEFNSILSFDFEDQLQRELFNIPSINLIQSIIGDTQEKKLLLLDEIQNLPKSGSILKLIHDHFPNTKVIATGSASYLLLKDIGDSLYGRNITLKMLPLTFREIVNDSDNTNYQIDNYNKKINKPEIDIKLEQSILYGTLPAVFLANSLQEKEQLLKNYIDSLLFKDVFEIEGIRNPIKFKKLLSLLALQISGEVNYNELATKLELSRDTVIEYINLYEKFQIIYTLKAFNRSIATEVSNICSTVRKSREISSFSADYKRAVCVDTASMTLSIEKEMSRSDRDSKNAKKGEEILDLPELRNHDNRNTSNKYPRKEITKNNKIYFVDLGIRNALINNFNNLSIRDDTGALFENIVINTIYANINYYDLSNSIYFWRNYNNSEVDLVISNNKTNKLIPIEIKFQKGDLPSKSFLNEYAQNIEKALNINKDNFWKFV